MSDELKRLNEALEGNEDLKEQFSTKVKSLIEAAQESGIKNEAEIMSAAASELGFNVSATDFEINAAEIQELDDEALEKVAGGLSWCDHNWTCWKDYRCSEVWVTDNNCLLSSNWFNE